MINNDTIDDIGTISRNDPINDGGDNHSIIDDLGGKLDTTTTNQKMNGSAEDIHTPPEEEDAIHTEMSSISSSNSLVSAETELDNGGSDSDIHHQQQKITSTAISNSTNQTNTEISKKTIPINLDFLGDLVATVKDYNKVGEQQEQGGNHKGSDNGNSDDDDILTSTTSTITTTSKSTTTTSSSNPLDNTTPTSSPRLEYVSHPTIAILPSDFEPYQVPKKSLPPIPTSASINHSRSHSTPNSDNNNKESATTNDSKDNQPQSTPNSPLTTGQKLPSSSTYTTSPPTTTTNTTANVNNSGPSFIKRIFRRDTSKTNVKQDDPQSTQSNSTNNNNNSTPLSPPSTLVRENSSSSNNSDGFFSSIGSLLSNSGSISKSAPATPDPKRNESKKGGIIEPFSLLSSSGSKKQESEEVSIPHSASTTSLPSHLVGYGLMDLEREEPESFAKLIEISEPLSYEVFLEKLESAAHIKSSIDSFVGKLKNRKGLANDDLREALMDFVSNTMHSLSNDERWSNSSNDELVFTSHHLQQYVIEKIYDYVFRATQDEIEKDQKLSDTIKQLGFVQPHHLEISVTESSELMWDEAAAYLQKINTTKSCRHKMMYIVKCCKSILNNLASQNSGESHGADSLLPNLIYVVLKTNPTNLNSNVSFISKFSDASDSEAVYYMTQLVSVIYFIENIKAESLKIDKKEFNKLMGTKKSKITNKDAAAEKEKDNENEKEKEKQDENKNEEKKKDDNGDNDENDPFVSRSTIFDDGALASLIEMFPDCDTQYLIDCINYIDTKHRHKNPPQKPLSISELVNRVTNMIAEHQGYLQVSPNIKTKDKKKSPGNISIPRSSSTSFQSLNINSKDSPTTPTATATPTASTTIISTTTALQQLLGQKEKEVEQLKRKTHNDENEILELKKKLQLLQQNNKKNSRKSLEIDISTLHFGNVSYDQLKLTDLPKIYEEYQKMFNLLKNLQQHK